MTNSAERVRALVASGAISPEEGRKLIAALAPPSAHPPSTMALLVNPFERFGGPLAAAVGGVVAVLGGAVERLGVRYNGLLDLHTASRTPTLAECAADQLASFVLPTFIAWCIALVAGRQARLVDLVGAVGVARAPYLVAGLVTGLLAPGNGEPHGVLLWTIVSLVLGALAWMITLLFQGFRNATGLAGRPCTVAFVAFIVLSEIASVALLSVLVGRSS